MSSPDLLPELDASLSSDSPNMLIPRAYIRFHQPSPTYDEIQFVPLPEHENLMFGEIINTMQSSNQPSV